MGGGASGSVLGWPRMVVVDGGLGVRVGDRRRRGAFRSVGRAGGWPGARAVRSAERHGRGRRGAAPIGGELTRGGARGRRDGRGGGSGWERGSDGANEVRKSIDRVRVEWVCRGGECGRVGEAPHPGEPVPGRASRVPFVPVPEGLLSACEGGNAGFFQEKSALVGVSSGDAPSVEGPDKEGKVPLPVDRGRTLLEAGSDVVDDPFTAFGGERGGERAVGKGTQASRGDACGENDVGVDRVGPGGRSSRGGGRWPAIRQG